MSRRQIRRMIDLKEQLKEHENEESDEEKQPEPSLQPRQTFEGLEVSSSDSESEGQAIGGAIESTTPPPKKPVPEEDKYGAKKKIYTEAQLQKQQRNAQKVNKKSKSRARVDEDDWLNEIPNEVLGDLPQRFEEMVIDKRQETKNQLYHINPAHLDVNNEIAKVFGIKKKKPLHSTHQGWVAKRWIGLSPDLKPPRVRGLDMVCYKTEDCLKFFKFVHNAGYTKCYRDLIEQLRVSLETNPRVVTMYTIECVEAFIENFDSFYKHGLHAEGREQIEHCICIMQQVAEPTFNYLDGNTRILYEIVENRPFHIALLKYIYMLSNIALHKTALTIAKVMLRLDPSDPLAVNFIIDTLAIRAREFQWLINFVEQIELEHGSAHRCFNMQYSRALALYQIAHKTQQLVKEANGALFKAITCYPSVVIEIIDVAKIPVPDTIKNHVLFQNRRPGYPNPSNNMQQVIQFYAWLTGPRWQEPHITKWVNEILKQAVQEYDRSSELRDKVLVNATLVREVYRFLPIQLLRHFHSIRAMDQYVGDGRMPSVAPTVSFNPYPTKGPMIDIKCYYSSIPPSLSPRQGRYTIMDCWDYRTFGLSLGDNEIYRGLPAPSHDLASDNHSAVTFRNGEGSSQTGEIRHALFSEGRDEGSAAGPPILQCHELAEVVRQFATNEDNIYKLPKTLVSAEVVRQFATNEDNIYKLPKTLVSAEVVRQFATNEDNIYKLPKTLVSAEVVRQFATNEDNIYKLPKTLVSAEVVRQFATNEDNIYKLPKTLVSAEVVRQFATNEDNIYKLPKTLVSAEVVRQFATNEDNIYKLPKVTYAMRLTAAKLMVLYFTVAAQLTHHIKTGEFLKDIPETQTKGVAAPVELPLD